MIAAFCRIFGTRLPALLLMASLTVSVAQEKAVDAPSVGAAWAIPVGVKTLSVNGYPMAYVERGTGPVVVFVHGALCDYRFWEPQVVSLSARMRVVSLSLRHHFPERWDGDGSDYSIKIHAEDIARFVEGLGSGPVDLVGHSRGGAVAAMLAQTRPELVRRLVLAEPGILSLLPAPGADDPRVAAVKQLGERFKKGDIEGALEFFLDGVNAPGTWKSRPEAVRQAARDNARTISRQAADTESIGAEGVASLKMPVLLIGGEKSSRMFGAILDAAQKSLPTARRVTLPNAGHVVSLSNQEAFDRALSEFLLK